MKEVGLDAFAAAHAAGGQVVDVREGGEYASGYVPGAVSMPMGLLPSRVDEIDKAAPVYVICQSGNRSAAMTDFLSYAGFDAYSVADGTSGWIKSGRPLEFGHEAKES